MAHLSISSSNEIRRSLFSEDNDPVIEATYSLAAAHFKNSISKSSPTELPKATSMESSTFLSHAHGEKAQNDSASKTQTRGQDQCKKKLLFASFSPIDQEINSLNSNCNLSPSQQRVAQSSKNSVPIDFCASRDHGETNEDDAFDPLDLPSPKCLFQDSDDELDSLDLLHFLSQDDERVSQTFAAEQGICQSPQKKRMASSLTPPPNQKKQHASKGNTNTVTVHFLDSNSNENLKPNFDNVTQTCPKKELEAGFLTPTKNYDADTDQAPPTPNSKAHKPEMVKERYVKNCNYKLTWEKHSVSCQFVGNGDHKNVFVPLPNQVNILENVDNSKLILKHFQDIHRYKQTLSMLSGWNLHANRQRNLCKMYNLAVAEQYFYDFETTISIEDYIPNSLDNDKLEWENNQKTFFQLSQGVRARLLQIRDYFIIGCTKNIQLDLGLDNFRYDDNNKIYMVDFLEKEEDFLLVFMFRSLQTRFVYGNQNIFLFLIEPLKAINPKLYDFFYRQRNVL